MVAKVQTSAGQPGRRHCTLPRPTWPLYPPSPPRAAAL